MWTDSTYFYGAITIPNLDGEGIVPITVRKNLDWFIGTYEPEYIKLILGDTCGSALIAGMIVSEGQEPLEKWSNLKAKFVDSVNKLSAISDYVYYHSERNRFTSSTLSGEKQSKHENSESVINTDKMMGAYNRSMKAGQAIRDWMDANIADYPEYITSELQDLDFTMNNYGL